MAKSETRLHLMTVARNKYLEQIRLLEYNLDYARRINEAHVSRLEAENAKLRQELEAAKVWQAAWKKGRRRKVG